MTPLLPIFLLGLLPALVPPLVQPLVPALLQPLPAAGAPGAAGPADPVRRVRPLPAPLVVARWWDPPPTPYAAGHRGVDLAAPVGAEVRAVGPGRVHYAGQVAGRGVLSLTLPGGLRTTFEPVRPLVAEGEAVRAGQVVAVLEAGSHCRASCLHWGLLAGEVYLNPLPLVPRSSPRLLPSAGAAGLSPVRRGAPWPRPPR
ncbi:M23 family metallopeptidase [Streptomyces sp. NPDC089799]|uniref:M23 family metallopeptidase n=1 Tax=Streptomyces sp. NPDC089799 TaxID=3155066 RepID=UPI00343D09FF